MKKEVLIIIPAYNEEHTIRAVLDDLNEAKITDYADILVMNDASKDDTNYIVKKENCILVTHVFNLGYGAAVQLGYKYAVRKGYQYVIQMDADGQHDVNNVPKILEALKTKDETGRYPDIVIGSRYLEGAKNYQTSRIKRFAIWMFKRAIKKTTGKVITDPTSGLQGFRFPAFLYYSKYANFDDHYPDANMIMQMLLLKFHVVEIPADMHNREYGKSMHSGLMPFIYMCWLGLSMFGILIRYKWLKIDEGIGEKNVVWETKRRGDKTEI
ncbi:MAG: glycosyltransferase family 2 protein [Lachnospiraceae bacterium]|nr:glycosyltransferase family 2 protein [Lachnospiraceae bacterium]